MIELFGATNTSEGRAAKNLIELFKYSFPDLEKSEDLNLKVYSGAKFHGYQIKDIDCILICQFNSPQRFNPVREVKTEPNEEIEKKEIFIESMVLCIEVKDHDAKFIKFEGTSVQVSYQRNIQSWHDASEQNMKQAHTLKTFFNDEFGKAPWVTNLIYLSSLEEGELPRRPHNIITPNIKPRDFFTVICEQSNPYKRANKKTVFSCSPPEFKDKYINSSLFKTNIPTSLDRKKVDAISRKEGFNEAWMNEVGKRLMIFRGSAGTGKTIALLQLANELFEKKGSRTLCLTYNKALVSDISRITMYLGLPSNVDDGGVNTQSCMSFFYSILKSFSLIPEDVNFLNIYSELINEMQSALNNNLFSNDEIDEVFKNSPNTYAYDYVFIDEGQDWPKEEIQIIKRLFGTERLVIADGLDQLIRGARAEWTFGLKEAERIIFSFDSSLRMKSNLTYFTNQLAKNEGINIWKLKQHNKIKGGSISLVTGDFYEILPKLKVFIEEAISNKNKPIDLLMLITHQLAEGLANLKGEKYTLAQSLLECKINPGFLDEYKSKVSSSYDELRMLHYQSARGLEGWTTFLMNFDQFIENQKQDSIKQFESQNITEISKEEYVDDITNRWIMMMLTRSVDTTVIHFQNKDSLIYEKMISYSEKYPDFINVD